MTTTVQTSLFVLAAGATLAQAQTAATPPSVTTSSAETTIQEIKHPVSWLTWGGDFRARNEYFNNLLTLDPGHSLHEQDYFRFRARLWTSITPVDDLSLNARLATEPREWMKPAGYTPMRGQSGMDWTEGVIDNLNLQWRRAFGLPATLTVGRQDIMIGDGWLTGDGTPYDGSWTYYLDAARLTYELKEQHTTIDAIGIIQPAKDDAWLPTINNQNRYNAEQNEKGVILSVVNSSVAKANLNPYFIYKQDNRISDPMVPPGGDSADIYTLGARIFGFLDEHWKYSVEGAYQFGQKQDPAIHDPSSSMEYRDMSAYGLNSRLTYLFKDSLNNQLTLSYELLSGDDPNSKDDEMFDVLWGRYPFWSEFGLYSYARETRVGQQANLHRIGPSWTVTPLKNLDFSASYYALFAPEEVATRGAAGLFTGDSNFRGHFCSAILKYKFSPHLSGHLWSELFFPGDYYVHKDMMDFLRAELSLTF